MDRIRNISSRRNSEWMLAKDNHLFVFGNDIAVLAHELLDKSGVRPYPRLAPNLGTLRYNTRGGIYLLTEEELRPPIILVNSHYEPDESQLVTKIQIQKLKSGIEPCFEWYSNGNQVSMEQPEWLLGLTDAVKLANFQIARKAYLSKEKPNLIEVPHSIMVYRNFALNELSRQLRYLSPLPVKESSR